MFLHRALTAIVLLPILIWLVLFAPQDFLLPVVVVLWGVGGYEWGGFMRLQKPLRYAYGALIAALVAAMLFGLPTVYDNYVYWASAGFWLLAVVLLSQYPKGFKPPANGADQQVSLKAVIGLFVLVPAALAIIRLKQLDSAQLIAMLFFVFAADVGGYIFGKQFGKHKLIPRVSPGKTWEGVAGGVVGASLIAAVAVWYFQHPLAALPAFLGLAGLVVFASIVGDLTESMFKRQAELKDSGRIMPGHGGILDRIDGVVAAAPLYALGLSLFGLA